MPSIGVRELLDPPCLAFLDTVLPFCSAEVCNKAECKLGDVGTA